MIEKLDIKNGGVEDLLNCIKKINELVDAVNELQESQNTYWTDIAEIKKELQTRSENVQPDAKSRSENVTELTHLQKENSYLKDKLEHITDILYESKYALEEIINPTFVSHEQEMAQEALDKVNAEIKAITGE